MKASELMIGDYVTFKESIECDNIPMKVKIVALCFQYRGEEDEALVQIDDDNACDIINIDNEVVGYPLTPEILEKNGFENIGDDTYQLEEKPCWFWVDFFNHQYGCEYDTSTHEYEDDEHRLKLYGIPSVHELQHALRLCGIEKEIEL